jgi:hypothetical protein
MLMITCKQSKGIFDCPKTKKVQKLGDRTFQQQAFNDLLMMRSANGGN